MELIFGTLGAGIICTGIPDQLGVVWRKLPQFESAFGNIEERVLLRDDLHGCVAEDFRLILQAGKSFTRALISILAGIRLVNPPGPERI
jgi:hypothetical protein